MLLLTNTNNVPELNLAAEECFISDGCLFQEAVMLWRNDPSVIVGRYQNTLEEINFNYIKRNNIPVVRRLSGGGSVYHDLGNVNFTFFMHANENQNLSMARFLNPIVATLEKLGVNARISGRNDLTVEGRKISGNAQYLSGDRFMHHGCLLFNTDLEMMSKILNPSPDKFISKSVKSVRSRVANISEFLKGMMQAEDFMSLLTSELASSVMIEKIDLFREKKEEIERLAREKYFEWSWNYGSSPPFNYKNSLNLPVGKLELRLSVKRGIIEHVKIYGDFLPTVDTMVFEKALAGSNYEESILAELFSRDPSILVFIARMGMSIDQTLHLFFEGSEEKGE